MMQLKVADLVSWEELKRMQVPIFRESYSRLLDNDITHPFDTAGECYASAQICTCMSSHKHAVSHT
jgi:hypothetical protein